MYEALSSGTLEDQFGSTELEVMFQDDTTRIICTKAVGDGRVLEISRVVFAPDAAANFPEPYQAMLAGESMGKAFTSRGIKFQREINNGLTCDLPPAFRRWFGGTHEATVIDLSVLVGPNKTLFAEILETYRPGVEWPYLSGNLTAQQFEQINLINDFLKDRLKAS